MNVKNGRTVTSILGGSTQVLLQEFGNVFGLKILGKALNFGIGVLLARILGADGYGVYVYAISWASVLSRFSRLGLSKLITREIAGYQSKKSRNEIYGIIRWATKVVLATSVVVVALFVCITYTYKSEGALEVDISPVWAALVMVPFLSTLHLYKGVLRGNGSVVEAKIPNRIVLPVTFVLVLGGTSIVYPLGYMSSVIVRVLSVSIACYVALYLVIRDFQDVFRSVKSKTKVKNYLMSTFPIFISESSDIIMQRSALVIIGPLIGVKAVGVYEVARKGASLVTFAVGPITTPLSYQMANLYSESKLKELQKVYSTSTLIGLVSSTAIGFSLYFFSDLYLLLFGGEFLSGSLALLILCSGRIFDSGMGQSVWLLNMTGYEKYPGYTVFVSSILCVILTVVLIPLFGIEGAALANTLSIVLWNLILCYIAVSEMGIYPIKLSSLYQR